MSVAEVTAAVLLALVIARVVSVVLRRLWEPIAAMYLIALPKERRVPAWLFVAHELVTNERMDAE